MGRGHGIRKQRQQAANKGYGLINAVGTIKFEGVYQMTEEQRKIAEANIGLVKFAIGKYLQHALVCIEYDDAVSIGNMALCKAAETYNPNYGTFSTYAIKIIIQHIHSAMRQHTRKKRGAGYITISLDNCVDTSYATLGVKQDISNNIIDKIAFEPVWELCPTFTLLDDTTMTVEQIARQEGVSSGTLFTRRRKELKKVAKFLSDNELVSITTYHGEGRI